VRRLFSVGILSALLFAGCATGESHGVLVTPDGRAIEASSKSIPRDSTGRPISHALIGQKIPTFQGDRVDGDPFHSDELAGQWTLIVAWGVWCHDSRNDLANIAAVADFAAEEQIGFISVHVPYSADHLDILYRKYGSVDAFFGVNEVAFDTVLDETAEVRSALAIEWTPTYLLVAPDLTVQGFRTDGPETLAAFLSAVQARIDQASPAIAASIKATASYPDQSSSPE